jgi:MFS family permease
VHAERRPPWVRRLTITVGLALGVIVVVILASSFLPRWWAHRVAAQASGNFTAGIALGLTYGFVFTFIPLAVLWWAFRRRRTVRTWALMIAAALALALPNLLTLGIVLGSGGAAHAGERTLDVEAPGYRNAALAGAIIAVVVFVAGGYLLTSRRRTRQRADDLREELRARDAAGAGAAAQAPRPENRAGP